MQNKWFFCLASLILLAGLILRVIPASNNNFYFTVDQGRDGVYVREFLEHGKILTRGPETTIRGIFTGPGWYYFISIGYFLFRGHPFGAIFMLILLNLVVTGFLMFQVKKRVGALEALVVGASLQGFWFFYDTSRFAFNPFPLVALSILLVIWLGDFLQGHKKKYYLAVIPVLLAFNANIAGAAALALFYALVGLYGAIKRKISWKMYVLFTFAIPTMGAVKILRQAWLLYRDVRVLEFKTTTGVGVFESTNFSYMASQFLEIVGNATIPQIPVFGAGLIVICYLLIVRTNRRNEFVTNFVNLTVVLFATSYLFFGSNKGWYDWHTVYLPVLLYVSLILMFLSIPRKIGIFLILLIVSCQLLLFQERYVQYLKPANDPSILANQINVVDWIYSKREEDGFSTYVYTPREFDYPYQYLFWWHGKSKYGFVPCEYMTSRKPGFLKHTYIPGEDRYRKPSLGCAQFRFVIIEPEKDQSKVDAWKEEQKITEGTQLLEETTIAGVRIEKRKLQLDGLGD